MINLVQQPTADSCTSACLSMLTGIAINDIISSFHNDWKLLKSNPSEFLSHQGVKHSVNKDVFSHKVNWGNVYLLTVPSLNIEGGLHHIVLDLTGDFESVLDPNNGKEGKKYYTGWSHDAGGLQVKLKSWMVDIVISGNEYHG